ncbi:RagB/SusD family nutrient uptake outer membrane protein [Sphingobacterium sp. UBA1498]|uniref:RagB/SusD family nutrient uptake outer membrane protein n=1 Tax=Sphingobacterium sp. UBA1498 TaxID=1947481 RepID=UPI0025CF9521|nr:RagB/SusD family nutrient uptake outer membrane protein [Sphingobacterium sp. UBA1498]
MKKTVICVLACAMLGIASCNKFEHQPEERILLGDVFDPTDKEGAQAKAYLFGIYSFLPNGFNRITGDMLDAATDDAVPSSETSDIRLFTNGQLTAVNYPDNNWQNSYTIIRRANVFLQNISVVPIPENMIRRYKAEARFLRAFAYFELLKRYGGIPIVGDNIFELSDDLNIPRSSYAECVDLIASECEAIKGDLPAASSALLTTTEYGRVTNEAALALKLRLYLYAASPLFNGGGVSVNPQIKLLNGYPDKDNGRWTRVLSTAEELIAKGYHKLPAGTGSIAYANIFTTKVNTDIIFAKQSANSTSLEANNAPVGYVAPAASNGRTSPTQNFVNAFPMDTGLPYVGLSTNLSQYENRDPRLKAILFYNGVRWLSRPIETFEGGLDKPNKPFLSQTKTAYYLRKFLGDFTNATTYANQSHNFPYFRYAEVLLSYAEALNEVGRTEDAVKQITLIRARAGIKPGNNSRYGISEGIAQTAMRDLIKNERRIELAFEEHRFWDIRRWKDAGDIKNSLKGLVLHKSGASVTAIEQMLTPFHFETKYYHMPIPYSETSKNRALIQNEGYY